MLNASCSAAKINSYEDFNVPNRFLAVDMQVYVVVCALTLMLVRRARTAFMVLPALVVVSVTANFFIAYHWSLKPIVMVMNPEYVHSLHCI